MDEVAKGVPRNVQQVGRGVGRERARSAALLSAPLPRHGGASWDALKKRRSMQEIQARGRWRAEQSVRKYEKHARLLKETQKLRVSTRRYGSKIDAMLSQILAGKLQKIPVQKEDAGLTRHR